MFTILLSRMMIFSPHCSALLYCSRWWSTAEPWTMNRPTSKQQIFFQNLQFFFCWKKNKFSPSHTVYLRFSFIWSGSLFFLVQKKRKKSVKPAWDRFVHIHIKYITQTYIKSVNFELWIRQAGKQGNKLKENELNKLNGRKWKFCSCLLYFRMNVV